MEAEKVVDSEWEVLGVKINRVWDERPTGEQADADKTENDIHG